MLGVDLAPSQKKIIKKNTFLIVKDKKNYNIKLIYISKKNVNNINNL